jgi:hypothetical protein
VHFAVLGLGLAATMVMLAGDSRLTAQEANRAEDAAVTLAGRKIRFDKGSGRLLELSQQEARQLVDTLTAMTTRTEQAAAMPSGATLLQMNGFDHVLVGRPNEDGTTDVQCVSSVEDAVVFLSQQPKSSGKE